MSAAPCSTPRRVLAGPLHDTLKRADDSGGIVETLSRDRLWRALTPQMFRLSSLRSALERALEAGQSVTDESSAHTAREISKTEGLFVGYTSGAAMQALKQLNEDGEFKKGDKVVVIFPDHGSRYMSKIYSDKWMEEQGFFDSQTEVSESIQYVK